MCAGKLHRKKHQRGFTLLEVTLALLLSSFIITGIFLFVEVNLSAVETMTVDQQSRAKIDGLEALLKGCVATGASPSQIKLEGLNSHVGRYPTDELSFDAVGGNAVLSETAAGTYRVKLRLKEDRGISYLGMERQPISEGIVGEISWLPLMRDIFGLDFTYFDTRQNDWTEEWNQPGQLPRLIRIRYWTEEGQQKQLTVFIPPKGVAW